MPQFRRVISWQLSILFYNSFGQIIATSHDRFPPNGGLVREITLFQGNRSVGEILYFGQIHGQTRAQTTGGTCGFS